MPLERSDGYGTPRNISNCVSIRDGTSTAYFPRGEVLNLSYAEGRAVRKSGSSESPNQPQTFPNSMITTTNSVNGVCRRELASQRTASERWQRNSVELPEVQTALTAQIICEAPSQPIVNGTLDIVKHSSRKATKMWTAEWQKLVIKAHRESLFLASESDASTKPKKIMNCFKKTHGRPYRLPANAESLVTDRVKSYCPNVDVSAAEVEICITHLLEKLGDHKELNIGTIKDKEQPLVYEELTLTEQRLIRIFWIYPFSWLSMKRGLGKILADTVKNHERLPTDEEVCLNRHMDKQKLLLVYKIGKEAGWFSVDSVRQRIAEVDGLDSGSNRVEADVQSSTINLEDSNTPAALQIRDTSCSSSPDVSLLGYPEGQRTHDLTPEQVPQNHVSSHRKSFNKHGLRDLAAAGRCLSTRPSRRVPNLHTSIIPYTRTRSATKAAGTSSKGFSRYPETGMAIKSNDIKRKIEDINSQIEILVKDRFEVAGWNSSLIPDFTAMAGVECLADLGGACFGHSQEKSWETAAIEICDEGSNRLRGLVLLRGLLLAYIQNEIMMSHHESLTASDMETRAGNLSHRFDWHMQEFTNQLKHQTPSAKYRSPSWDVEWKAPLRDLFLDCLKLRSRIDKNKEKRRIQFFLPLAGSELDNDRMEAIDFGCRQSSPRHSLERIQIALGFVVTMEYKHSPGSDEYEQGYLGWSEPVVMCRAPVELKYA